MEKLLYNILLTSPNNLFDAFIIECQKSYEAPAHTLTEMRNRNNKKIKGDIFEEFCVLYLKHIKNYKNVWLLKYVPEEILKKLTLQRRDMGIDIIVEINENVYYAVQCKYKKHTSMKKNILSWSALSTFYALCLRTGPWDKYIIMTNCSYTRHQGKKTAQDLSICLKTLQNINKDDWLKMCGKTPNILGYKCNIEPVIGSIIEPVIEPIIEPIIEQNINIEPVIEQNINTEPNIEPIIELNNLPILQTIKVKKNKSKIIIPTKEEIRKLREKFYNL